MIVFAFAACTAPATDVTDTADSAAPVGVDSGGGDWFEAPAVVPELDADGVDEAIRVFASNALVLPAELEGWLFGVFYDVVGAGTRCPPRDESTDRPGSWTSFWGGACTGSIYDVAGDWQIDVTEATEGATRVHTVVSLFSFLGTTVATNEPLAAGGNVNFSVREDPGMSTLVLSYGGTWMDAAEEGPLHEGVSAAVTLSGVYVQGEGFTGTLAGPSSSESAALDLRTLTFTPGCAAPSGTFAVRDPSSGWWEIALTDDCSGCGALTWYGEDYGTSCAALDMAENIVARMDAAYGSHP